MLMHVLTAMDHTHRITTLQIRTNMSLVNKTELPVRAAPAAHSAAPEPVELQSTDEWHLSLPLLEAGLLRVEGEGSSAWDAPLQLTPAMFDIRRSARLAFKVLAITYLHMCSDANV
jgi:hypothetical protein